jgi:hypothetical protein
VRLGFVVVERADPNILLLDEVHEALDHEFRQIVAGAGRCEPTARSRKSARLISKRPEALLKLFGSQDDERRRALAVPAQAHRRGVPAQTKLVAERNLVRIAPRSWSHSRIPMLIDEQTGLLRNNVRAICHGRGQRYRGSRYARFVCLLRPWPLATQRQLFVAYRARARGRFRCIGWVLRRA